MAHRIHHRFLIAALGVAACYGAPALAADAMIEGAKLCTKHFANSERQNGIPTHLLSAIASTESGRYHQGLGIRIPWPWTINAAGKGYYFATKDEAIAAVRKLRARGVDSIDVGCMQVNLMHHPRAFTSLEQAFDPKYNVQYAAGFLRDLYQETRSWKEAAGDYHSKTPARGKQYVGQVYSSWSQILEKLRMAKVKSPASTQVAANQPAPQFRAKPVKVIEVSKKNNVRSRDVIIVRPDRLAAEKAAAVPPLKVAQAKTLAITPAAFEALAPAAGVSVQPEIKKSGPAFIFND